MKKFVNHYAYLIFLIAIPLVLLVSVKDLEATFDLNIYDTYYVIRSFEFGILVSLLFVFYAIVYWLMQYFKRKTFYVLTFIHIILSLGSFLIIQLIDLKFLEKRDYSGNNYPSQDLPYFENIFDLDLISILCVFVFLISQLFFLINLVVATTKKSIISKNDF